MIRQHIFEELVSIGYGIDTFERMYGMSRNAVEEWCMETYEETFEQLALEVEYAKHPNQDKDRPYTVYMHIAPNGKKYVGITKSALNRRWLNGKGYWSNSHFTNAINQYGWENIQHAILYMRLTKEEAEAAEIEMIKRFKTTNRDYGYNIEGGGGLRKEVSEETREKLRRNATGVHCSDETRCKMSESHKGERCHFYGTHLTDEQKRALRELKSKAVQMMDENGNVLKEYSSMKEAAEAHNVTRQAITAACTGKRKKAVGYWWRYKDGKTAERD